MGRLIQWVFCAGIPHHGSRLLLPSPRSDKLAAQLAYGFYERAEIAAIQRFLPRHLPVVELGSSIGAITCLLARLVEWEQPILTVEADPALAAQTIKNLRHNNLQDRVHVVNRAVAYGQTEVSFGGIDTLSGHIGGGDAVVSATTLSALLGEFGLREYVLVCDIEGAEVPMILEDGRALACCKFIIMELDGGSYKGTTYKPDDVEQLVERSGFQRVYRYGRVAAFSRLDSPE